MRALLKDATKGIYFVAEADGAVIGQLLITYEWSDWRNGYFWWIQSVYVAAKFRSEGVFRTLFGHVQKLAKSRRNVCGLRLYVEKNNRRARQAYDRLGMKHTHYEIYETNFR
ncbi:MAG: GNAT family N-acetyltransferase [Verrucomicrobiota bacterium]